MIASRQAYLTWAKLSLVEDTIHLGHKAVENRHACKLLLRGQIWRFRGAVVPQWCHGDIAVATKGLEVIRCEREVSCEREMVVARAT
jgi:hypothetical protein